MSARQYSNSRKYRSPVFILGGNWEGGGGRTPNSGLLGGGGGGGGQT